MVETRLRAARLQAVEGGKALADQIRMRRAGEEDRIRNLRTQSNIEPKPVYRPEDVSGLDYNRDLGDPGRYPFTRGRFPNGYRERLWVRSQIAGYGGAEDSREEYRYLIEDLKITGLRIAPDVVTIMGLDPDHPLALGTVGCAGPPTYCLDQLDSSLSGISLVGGAVDVGIGSSWGAVPVYAMLVALAKRRGISPEELRGDMVNDVLHSFATESCVSQPFDVGWRLCIDGMEYAHRATPNFHVCNPNGYDFREGGADAMQEVGLVLAERMAYIDALLARGVPFSWTNRRMVLGFGADVDFFETICKVRAARRLWARIGRDRYDAPDDFRVTAPALDLTGSGHSAYAQQPALNIARSAIETLAAVLCGAQSIGVRPYDEAVALPTRQSFGLAAQIHHLVAQETGAALVADPLAGSYYVEWLTNRIEEGAVSYMKEIDDHGGIVEAVQSGWLSRELREAVLKREQAIDEGRTLVVGVNAFQVPKDWELEIPVFGSFGSENHRAKQRSIIAECRQYKENRDKRKVGQTLAHLYRKTRDGANVVSPMVESVEAGATHAEVLGVIREAMGYTFDPFQMVPRPDFLDYK